MFEVGEFQGQPYIAMEYIDGQPLHQIYHRLSTEQKVLLIQQIALAVQSAHSQGILHRDLKPANIMVCETKGDSAPNGVAGLRPVLMDFGLARDSLGPQRLTQTGVIMGTPHYMAPEQARGMARHLDRRADVYSLGAMLYELLCGRPPFDAENEVDLLMAVLHQDPTELRKKEPSIPIDLEVITHKCLRKEPIQRYDSAQALADDLGRYLRAEPILARPATTLYRLRRMAARHRGAVAVVTVILVSLLSLLGVWGQARAQQKRQAAQAAEQERLATQLGQSVTEMKLFLRVAYSLPPHDLNRDYEVVRKRLQKLETQLKESDPFLHGTIESALGQGFLALGKHEYAVTHLQRAIDLGKNSTGTHLALAESLLRIFQVKQRDVQSRFDPEEAQRRVASLRKLYVAKARQELLLVKQADTPSSAYVDALLLRYADKPDLTAALQMIRKAEEESPWTLEPLEQEFQILREKIVMEMRTGNEDATLRFSDQKQALEQAISMARSYPPFYHFHTELLVVQFRGSLTQAMKTESLLALLEDGQKYAAILKVLLPNDPESVDAQIGLPAALAFAQGWNGIDPTETVTMGLNLLAEARKVPPERARTYQLEIALHQAVAYYKTHMDQDPSDAHAKAFAAAKRVMELAPEESETWARLALTQSMLAESRHQHGHDSRAKMREAIEFGIRAAKLQPDKPILRNNLGAFYLFQAELERDWGSNPLPIWQAGREALLSVLRDTPNFQLSLENLAELQQSEVLHMLQIGHDPSDKLPELRQHAEQLIQKFPTHGEVLRYAFQSLLVDLKAQSFKQDVSAQIDALVQRIQGPLGAPMQPGRKQDLLLQLALLQEQTAIRYGQSPEAALRTLLTVAPLHDIPIGGQKKLRIQSKQEGLRIFAEYLLSPAHKPVGSAPGIPRTPLAAIDAALLLSQPLIDRPSNVRLDVLAEQAILHALKARLVAKAERVALSQTAQTEMQEVLRTRPHLTNKLRPYQTEAEAPKL